MDSREIRCPACNADALYQYGKSHHGKKRYLCEICGRQFVVGKDRQDPSSRPSCPICGKSMHVYKRENYGVRFRCSGYPLCPTYCLITRNEGV